MGFLEEFLGLQKGHSISIDQINQALQAIPNLDNEELYNQLAPEFSKIRDPSIFYSLAEVAFSLGLDDEAKNKCLIGAGFGLKGGNKSYDNGSAESIGHCISLLMNQVEVDTFSDKDRILEKATAIGYVCLSKHIANNSEQSQLARKGRFTLLEGHKCLRARINFTESVFGKNSLYPLCIADLFYIAKELEHTNILAYMQYRQLAKEFRKELKDISIRGVRGSEMKLSQLAGIGEQRHEQAFEKASIQYKNGDFDINVAQLAEACNL